MAFRSFIFRFIMLLALTAGVLFLVTGTMFLLAQQDELGVIMLVFGAGSLVISLVARVVTNVVEPELLREAGGWLYWLSALAAFGLGTALGFFMRAQLPGIELQDWAIYCTGAILGIAYLTRLIDVRYLRTAREAEAIEYHKRQRKARG